MIIETAPEQHARVNYAGTIVDNSKDTPKVVSLDLSKETPTIKPKGKGK